MADELDYWRRLFRGARGDIFKVIENAITVAASERPDELRARRDRIAERLFVLTQWVAGDPAENRGQSMEQEEEEEEEDDQGNGSVRREAGGMEGKVGSSNNEPEESELNQMVSNYSYNEAEALTEEIEEESQIVGEVLRIKEVLYNKNDETERMLFESLRRLQLMSLSVETLRATEIGRAVNGLRKHNSKQIRHLVRTLIEGWKVMVDEWVNATAAIADNSPDSLNPSSTLDEEEGLPSPPLDEGALLATQTTSIQLSGFFDGMDDDGNPGTSVELDKSRENGRSAIDNHKPVSKQQHLGRSINPEENVQMRMREQVIRQTRPQGTTNGHVKSQDIRKKQTKPPSTDFGPGRPPRPASEKETSNDMKFHRQQEQSAIQRKPLTALSEKPKCSDDALVRVKLELAKRKLHERYQEAENAKKQRTIQVMELQDIPKQANNYRHANVKPRNHLRNWANGWR